MLQYKELSWWYWVVTSVLLLAGVAGQFGAFYLAIALSAFQVVHFRLREGSVIAFPVQVRVGYTALLILASWGPLNWVFWVPAIGTPAQVLFGYCAMARCVSLLPWNRNDPLSWHLVRRAFFARPVKGSMLQGQPATTNLV